MDIQIEVANALHWDFAIPRHRIVAEVVGGVVTLKGLVDMPYQRVCAEDDVKRVPGVKAIRNEIAVKAAPGSSDRRLS